MNLFHIDKEFERKVQSITENICNFISRHKRILTVAILLSTFIVLFGNIYFSEYISDDLIYMNKWQSSEPISNLYDIFEYQINHYFLWGGRSIAHTILQLLFLIGKPVSAILTTLVFMICAYLINIYSCEKFNIITYSGIVGLLYFLNPIYSETIRWYTGSANYLWTITIVLVAIYPFVNVIKGKIPCQNNIYIYMYVMFFLLFSFLAGWCNENTSTTLLLFMISIILLDYKRNRRIQWLLVMQLCFSTIGCSLLVFAPGNYIRSSTFQTGIMSLMYRMHGQVNAFFNWLFPIILLLSISFYLLYRKKIKIPTLSIVFTIWGLLSMLIMLASPSYPQRATFGTFVLFIISFSTNISIIDKENTSCDKLFLSILLIIIWVAAIMSITSVNLVDLARYLGVNIAS